MGVIIPASAGWKKLSDTTYGEIAQQDGVDESGTKYGKVDITLPSGYDHYKVYMSGLASKTSGYNITAGFKFNDEVLSSITKYSGNCRYATSSNTQYTDYQMGVFIGDTTITYGYNYISEFEISKYSSQNPSVHGFTRMNSHIGWPEQLFGFTWDDASALTKVNLRFWTTSPDQNSILKTGMRIKVYGMK